VRGKPERQMAMLSTLSPEDLIPADHPIRRIRTVVDAVLGELDGEFSAMYAKGGRPSVPPEQLLKASVLMAMYSIRSERAFCERLNYDLLFKWFLDLAIDARAFDATTFSKNRQRLLDHEIADRFFAAVVAQAKLRRYVSSDHFSVDGTLLEAWASHKSVMSRDIADTCVGTSLTLGAGGLAVGGLVSAGSVEAEPADEAVGSVDGDVVAAGDDEELLVDNAGSDGDLVLVPVDEVVRRDGAEVAVGRFGDRGAGTGWWCRHPSFGGSGAVEGSVGPVVVVVADVVVELSLELAVVGREWLGAQPPFEGLVEAFDLAAGLGMSGAGTDVADPERAQVAFERGFAAGLEPAGKAGAVVAHDMRGSSVALRRVAERVPGGVAGRAATHPSRDHQAGMVVEDVHDPRLVT
jgi:transposase